MKQRDKLAELLPDVMGASRNLTAEVYKDGLLTCKVKRLMALALALGAGCRNCILSQTMLALESGATKDEILETISVVVSMRGTTGVAESLRVVQILDELGKL
jgi:AhpD family alkylhydroperoxidase